jgi:hypothetical protein
MVVLSAGRSEVEIFRNARLRVSHRTFDGAAPSKRRRGLAGGEQANDGRVHLGDGNSDPLIQGS